MPTFLPGPAGPLEMLYRPPEGVRAANAPIAAVVCHPHPAHGGTMHNKVVYNIARGLLDAGLHVLRFNYRGVGLSTGEYDEGRGEKLDIAAAIDWLAAQHPGEPLLLAGFSFGARFGLEVGLQHDAITRLIGVGLAVKLLGSDAIAGGRKPALFIHGDRDEFGTHDDVLQLAEGWRAPASVHIFKGCGHFFDGRLPDLQVAVSDNLSDSVATSVHWS